MYILEKLKKIGLIKSMNVFEQINCFVVKYHKKLNIQNIIDDSGNNLLSLMKKISRLRILCNT